MPIRLLGHINGNFLRREVRPPQSIVACLALTRLSDDQRYAPGRCFLIVTYALSLLKAQDLENKPNGEPGGIRTHNPRLKRALRYHCATGSYKWHLAYGPIWLSSLTHRYLIFNYLSDARKNIAKNSRRSTLLVYTPMCVDNFRSNIDSICV